MKHYPVLAEFVDVNTGDRHQRGGTFAPADTDQLERLVAARCLGKTSVAASNKPVADMSRSELEASAVDSFSDQLSSMTDDDLRAGIERSRARDAKDPADVSRAQINEDGLFDETVDKLKEIATKETIDLGDATKKADIVAAIRAARAAAQA